MRASDKEVAPRVLEHPGARPTERIGTLLWTAKSLAYSVHAQLLRITTPTPALTDGLVFLTYTVFDEVLGEEVERLEVVPPLRS